MVFSLNQFRAEALTLKLQRRGPFVTGNLPTIRLLLEPHARRAGPFALVLVLVLDSALDTPHSSIHPLIRWNPGPFVLARPR
jgi:hypothetical protein